jgi:hypothetical protein
MEQQIRKIANLDRIKRRHSREPIAWEPQLTASDGFTTCDH